jgi:hypothetical protein
MDSPVVSTLKPNPARDIASRYQTVFIKVRYG